MLCRKDLHIRDPFVYLENERYYLVGTTGDDSWGHGSDLTLYTSKDLESFEVLGCMVEKDSLSGYTNIWAPELHCYNGKYYLIVSMYREDLGRGSMIFVSSALNQKFLPLTGKYITPADWGCLDASLFIWKGKPYLFFSYEWTTQEGDGAIYVAELSPDLKNIVDEPKRIVNAKTCGFAKEISGGGYVGYVAEGPFAVGKNGMIDLYWSTFTEHGYCVIKNTAADIFSDYVFEKVIFEKDGGHCMVFTDLEGIQQITLHHPNTTSLERMRLFALE